MEIVDVIDIGADFGREELGIESRRFGSRSAVQPSPVREGERFSFLRLLLGDGLRLRVCFHLWDECFVSCNNVGSNFVGGGALRNWLWGRVFFQAFDFFLEFLDQLAELAYFIRTGGV